MFLEISQKFTGKRLCQSRLQLYEKKRLWRRCFPVNFAKCLKIPFLTKHLRWLLLKKKKPFKDEQKQKVLFITNILITAKSISKWTNFVETSSPTTLFLSFVFLHIKWKIITKNNHKFCELEFYYLKNWKMIFELVIEFYFKLFNFISECAFTRVINVCRCDWIIQLWTVINVCKCD